MRIFVNITLVVLVASTAYSSAGTNWDHSSKKWPTIGLSVLVRNKAHTLPYFLTCIHKLDYPKDRLYLWLYSDYNEDNSVEILNLWVKDYATDYKNVYIITNSSSGLLHRDENGPTHWSPERFRHVILLREQALHFARKMWADYVFMVDADVFLTNPNTLKYLVSKDLVIVAPMLISDGLYSNFWCGMTDNYYYKRTDEYKPILNRQNIGCFQVPMVHTAVLISLEQLVSENITYIPKKMNNYDGPEDDIIAFAINAKNNGIELNICNDYLYGFVPVPLEDKEDPTYDMEQIMNVKLEAVSRGEPIPLHPSMAKYVSFPERWKFGCNEIYMINLERRKERRHLMEISFKELGMDAVLVKAVDGRNLDLNDLKKHSITLMPGYEDPYHKRPMKAGEVGCFMSHYNIWKEIAEKHHKISLVLEDDIHFVPYFRNRFLELVQEIAKLDWDLLYLGRKVLLDDEEQFVTEHSTQPLYSYWSLGYLITERGARKLLDAKPLQNMLPVDEFLPIMFDQHPNTTWKSYFHNRNLKALSASPLLVHPTHYTGQEGYISDTEDSIIVKAELIENLVKNEL